MSVCACMCIRMYVRNSFIYVVVTIVTNCIVVSLGYGAEEVCFLESEETQQVWWVGQRAARVGQWAGARGRSQVLAVHLQKLYSIVGLLQLVPVCL